MLLRSQRFPALVLQSVLFVSGSTGMLAQSAGSSSTGSQQPADPLPPRKTAVILRFAVQSQPASDSSALSVLACPAPVATGEPQKPITVDPKILDAISAEMQKKLSEKMTVMVNPEPTAIPEGAMVITGCITRSDAGNGAERLIGMGLGTSHLNVHVVALTRTRNGWSPYDTFDIQVKGGSLLPPLGPVGLAVHAARDTQQTLSADARKLADKILKQLKKDVRSGAIAAASQTGQGI
ncbi:DUF4410 domain-containing protein [Silvibacterium acidisoli]|uniref:DUF4410 domain-containing protein n=1 Tax=Acidobacteriaceae bacterium ZG23-2 TaxID=2883246 RepID=UPI00406CEFAE